MRVSVSLIPIPSELKKLIVIYFITIVTFIYSFP